MTRPGFTILELVIAIGLLVLIGALAAPALTGRMAESRFEAAQSDLGSALVMARVDAQREGRPLALRAELAEGLAVLTVEPLTAPTSPGAIEQPPRRTAPRVTLPPGLRISDQRPSTEPATIAAAPEEISEGGDAPAEPITIAVFLLDGSAQSPGAAYLVQDEAGLPVRATEVRVNRWTGSPAFVPIDLSAEAPTPEVAEEPPARPSEPGGTP